MNTNLIHIGVTEEELENIHLLKYVRIDSILGLLENCSVQTLSPGEILITPGMRHNQAVYFILTGKLRVHLNTMDSDPIIVLGKGESVGEMSVIDHEPTSAYVIAQEPCRLLVMEEDILWSLVQSSHASACNLLFILTKRLRHTDSVIVENVNQEQVYERYGSIDALTGLHNRFWLDNILKRHCQRATSSIPEGNLSILLIDIDHFKEFNASYGHLYGDKVLYWLAHIISENLRPSEIIARYGGDEFIVLLPDVDIEKATAIAQRLHDIVCETPPPDYENTSPRPSLSIGVAQLQQGHTPDMLISLAESALHRAISNGRNCTSD